MKNYRMYIFGFSLLAVTVLLTGCFHAKTVPSDMVQTPPKDGVCRVTGCSGEVCADNQVGTTCEYKAEYACYKKTTCSRQPDGNCGWTKTAEFESCVAAALKEEFSSDPSVSAKADLIRVENIQPNALIVSPLFVKGSARGLWFFEASFPVQLEDSTGKVLASGHATAQEEWMTDRFVPFTTELTFSKPATKTGVLVLQKDNPSGLPEHDDELRFPVRFDD